MPTGHTTPLPLTTWDRDTLVEVALAYRRERALGARDLPARQAAETAHPLRWMPETEPVLTRCLPGQRQDQCFCDWATLLI